MRASFVFSEVLTGLRRNVTMTVAMILTTAISLGLLGGGLLVVRMIDQMEDLFQERVEVYIYLTEDVSATDSDCTQEPCASLWSSVQAANGIETVDFESRDRAYERFVELFQGQPELVDLTRPESLPAALKIKLEDPERYPALEAEFAGQPGVHRVANQADYLDRLFEVLAGVRNAVFAVALIQAVAALLLISNTIQLSAFTRRTEVGIMRLVGASRWYTQLPFLIEAVVAGVIGSLLAIGGVIVAKFTFLDRVLQGPIEASIIPRLGMADVLLVSPILLGVAVVISAVTGYVTLRLYVRT
ncbi:cell division transport system permease protein [Actinoalloteichus hoggarensis]|uniref:Cell division protein FtsX n=1 Tax=Actinoalloteichus hoggarensis TaxID=1470176 RepID=A0A221VZB8_9PSEU|nr:permease-like cell division protein FtsX [Actinoalloteichus hoggarensis]ASO18611.1 Cell division protein FtsX [Actinoalloteichus hoggarensis]MBB5921979.1 cell division transport system permease protein [Actinoalloteichus hoggarensis]